MRGKSLMVQGTASSVGKSVLCSALLRIMKQDGMNVAPFKAQNMALNSYVTKDGFEMGRAQVTQAQAAGKEPDVRMNPVLLKPTSDRRSQVIINGRAAGTMTAMEYHKYKPALRESIRQIYNDLESGVDCVVIEGAGSPAEINLREGDIVNMSMAKSADAPVLLVGDINLGGVFASLLGTVMLLTEEERARVKGIIINKFRGDVEILRPGLDMIEEKTGIPVVGVLPMLHVDIEDEDSLSERLTSHTEVKLVDIAVVRIPRMSNYTDFNVFELVSGVSLRYVSSVKELGNPDMIIIPGTKNTIGDLKWMRQNGLEAEILKKASNGTVVWGVCGGYQMLGTNISDPYGVEEGGDTPGMGLLNIQTSFIEKKRTIQMEGKLGKIEGIFSSLSGVDIVGYEIHSGVTEFPAEHALTSIKPIHEEGEVMLEGSQNVDGKYNVYGSYVHGIFDADGVAVKIVEALLAKKGMKMEDIKTINFAEYKKQQYDILADSVRKNLDMKKIYEILEAGV